MTIRDATDADLPAIVDTYNASIPGRMATADLEPISLESRREWFRQHSPDHHPIWVMQDGERIAGWLSLSAFKDRAAYAKTAEVSCYVAPDYHRRGVGRALMTEAIRRAPSLGLNTLISLVFGHNAPSLRLCESVGYERWGHLPRVADLDGIERDVVILGLRVADTSC